MDEGIYECTLKLGVRRGHMTALNMVIPISKLLIARKIL
jgi:hypothetical protein